MASLLDGRESVLCLNWNAFKRRSTGGAGVFEIGHQIRWNAPFRLHEEVVDVREGGLFFRHRAWK